jgi:DNA-binding beta-propeller fold protein YncE
LGYVGLPHHSSGGFDHADVYEKSGLVFVAHTANGTVEIIDGETLQHRSTVAGCPEASGILCAQGEALVFATSRGTGRILTLDAVTGEVLMEMAVGSKPNGLAWDSARRRLLVADVHDNQARLVDPHSDRILASYGLPGRPRWCVYDEVLDSFLVNIRDPAGLLTVGAESLSAARFLPVSVAGPHGLSILEEEGRALIACDGKAVVALDVNTGQEIGSAQIAGEPDVVWYNRRKARLYCAVGRPGVLEVVDTRNLSVIEEVATEEGAHTFAFDQPRQRVYVFLPRSCRASVYDES